MTESVQVFGRKRSAVAVAYCKKGKGQIKINGCPIELIEPEGLRYKVYEPILILGKEKFEDVDIRIRCKGRGYSSQIYAIRQAIAKSLVAYYQKCAVGANCVFYLFSVWIYRSRRAHADVDEAAKKDIREALLSYDRSLLVSRCLTTPLLGLC